MVHSAGSASALSGNPTQPVLTLRSGLGNEDQFQDQEVIARVELDEVVSSIRSAKILEINRNSCHYIVSIDMLFGVGLANGQASLEKYTVEILKEKEEESCSLTQPSKKTGKSKKKGDKISCDKNKVTRVELLGPDTVPLPGDSIRSLRTLPGDICGSSNDVVVFNPTESTDISNLTAPAVYVYDPNQPQCDPVVVSLDGLAAIMAPSTLWDFEIGTQSVFYNVVRVLPDFAGTLLSPIDLVPELYYGGVADLCAAAEKLCLSNPAPSSTTVTEFTQVRTDNEFSSHSLLPLGDTKVLACTQSGFLYQTIFGGGGGGFSDLEALELGTPQLCYVCDTTIDMCTTTVPPSQNGLSAYLWDVVECDGKVFVGTLDLSGLFVNIFRAQILDFISDIPEPILCSLEGPILDLLVDLFAYILMSMTLEQPFTKANGGFNIFYAESSDLENGTPNWTVVTTDGFNRVLDPHDPMLLKDPRFYYEEDFLGYLRGTTVEDGVRNMVCSGDRYLHVGSAVFGDAPSSTYILDLQNPTSGECKDALRPEMIM